MSVEKNIMQLQKSESKKSVMPVEVSSEKKLVSEEVVDMVEEEPEMSEIVASNGEEELDPQQMESFQEYFPESNEAANLMGVMIPAHVGFVRLVECPFCQRKFNEKAAERHIPKCKDAKSRPKPPPKRSEYEKYEITE